MIEFNKERYYLGGLCKRGHEYMSTGKTMRYKSISNRCVLCNSLSGKTYRSKNKDKIAAKDKTYRSKNKDKIAAKKKTYRSKNKDKIAAKKKIYNSKNKDKISAKDKEYYFENKDKVIIRAKGYRFNNKAKIVARDKKYRSIAPDGYIKGLLVRAGLFQKSDEIPQTIIDLRREQLLFYRLLKELKNELNQHGSERT